MPVTALESHFAAGPIAAPGRERFILSFLHVSALAWWCMLRCVVVQAWELFFLVASVMPPSKEFVSLVSEYVHTVAHPDGPAGAEDAQRLAAKTWTALKRSAKAGPRRTVSRTRPTVALKPSTRPQGSAREMMPCVGARLSGRTLSPLGASGSEPLVERLCDVPAHAKAQAVLCYGITLR